MIFLPLEERKSPRSSAMSGLCTEKFRGTGEVCAAHAGTDSRFLSLPLDLHTARYIQIFPHLPPCFFPPPYFSMFPEKAGRKPECLLPQTLQLQGEMRGAGRTISASHRVWVVVDVARAGSRTQHPEEKGGRKENPTHILRKNVTESKEAEEGFTLMDFQPRGIKQSGSRNADGTRSAVRGEGSRRCPQLQQLP